MTVQVIHAYPQKPKPYFKEFLKIATDRGKKVIELARKYNLLIVSDDVYNLTSRDTAPARLFSFDKK